MQIDTSLKPADLLPRVNRVLELASKKVRAIDKRWDPAHGTPVFTVNGKYTTRGWTEWTQGFQYGSALLCFDGTDDRELLELGRSRTVERMAPHVTHTGVHDHGFNNISTYGNLRRLMREGRFEHNEWEMKFYEMALKASGAVQAARWTSRYAGPLMGFIYSFNGPQSLFIDTMRTLRSLSLAHQLGHSALVEEDHRSNLLGKVVSHMCVTGNYLICDGEPSLVLGGRTEQAPYLVRGRTAHEGIFNVKTGAFRCRSSQQGYSPHSTWTRGLSWAILGYAEQLEFFKALKDGIDEVIDRFLSLASEAERKKTRNSYLDIFTRYLLATAEHYINDVTAADGIPYWDDGAPGLHKLGDWRNRPAEPFNDHEPVDSSAAAIAAQGLIRLGTYLGKAKGKMYLAAGLTVACTLFDEPYLATSSKHEGLILHSVYHRPNGWDHIPKGRKVPCGESSMWGDYHAIELAVLIQRLARGEYMTFFDR